MNYWIFFGIHHSSVCWGNTIKYLIHKKKEAVEKPGVRVKRTNGLIVTTQRANTHQSTNQCSTPQESSRGAGRRSRAGRGAPRRACRGPSRCRTAGTPSRERLRAGESEVQVGYSASQWSELKWGALVRNARWIIDISIDWKKRPTERGHRGFLVTAPNYKIRMRWSEMRREEKRREERNVNEIQQHNLSSNATKTHLQVQYIY